MGVMASIKCTHNYNGVFPKLKFIVVFLKYAEIAMASIQLTLTKNKEQYRANWPKLLIITSKLRKAQGIASLLKCYTACGYFLLSILSSPLELLNASSWDILT
jgi:hypothetical protein